MIISISIVVKNTKHCIVQSVWSSLPQWTSHQDRLQGKCFLPSIMVANAEQNSVVDIASVDQCDFKVGF